MPSRNAIVPLLLLTALVAAASAAIAVAGTWPPSAPSTPVVLGPLMMAAVIGACGLLARWQGTSRRGPGRELFGEPGPLGLYAGLLLAAAVLLAASGPRAGAGTVRAREK
jgi:hypothetical protein